MSTPIVNQNSYCMLAVMLTAGLISFGVSAQPQGAGTQSSSGSEGAVQLKAVVVNGASNNQIESTTTKMLVTQEDLVRFGDSNVVDVLKRLPGIAVSGVPGRGGEIRMRGLGSGYTQILINGEPVAPGFSLDSLTPSLIDRIEVTRTPTADMSAQAIAGTINVILKQSVRKRQRDVKIAVASDKFRPSTFVDAQLSDRTGDVSYTLAAGYKEERYLGPVKTVRHEADAVGQPTYATQIDDTYVAKIQTFTLTPRLNWTLNPRNSLNWDAQIFAQRSFSRRITEFETSLGAPLPYTRDVADGPQHYENIRTGLLWKRNLANDATLETKLGAAYFQRQRPVTTEAYDVTQALVLRRDVESPSRDTSFTLNGKYRTPFRKTHALVVGWNGEASRRQEDRLQHEVSPIGLPLENIDETFDARVQRGALFIQDEWDISKRWSAYLGLRSESIETRSNDNGGTKFTNRSSVLSPIMQSLWKIPNTKSDQIHLGLARTYKAPSTADLLPRRYITIYSAPTLPGNEGNPDLRPELAWSLDLAYERHFEDDGLLSVNLFERRIKDVILQEVFSDEQGRWIQRPINNGNAKVHGVELEAKTSLRKLNKAAPLVELRANLARNWSTVDSVPEPNNRLAQIPMSANIGADWHVSGVPLTIGGSFGFQQGGTVRRSFNETLTMSNKRTLEIYGLWVFDQNMQFRLSAANLLHEDITEKREYLYNAGGLVQQTRNEETAAIFRLALELKL